jgi:Domain of unknown function (DUF397)
VTPETRNADTMTAETMTQDAPTPPVLTWTKAKASDSNGSCLEVAQHPEGGRYVRDSKNHGGGPTLYFTAAEWTAFLDGARNGEFD